MTPTTKVRLYNGSSPSLGNGSVTTYLGLCYQPGKRYGERYVK
ncbi:hypothetical protein [Bacillus weihaiensis]|nr:hypothetical protein [Bacillus weihaiensis]